MNPRLRLGVALCALFGCSPGTDAGSGGPGNTPTTDGVVDGTTTSGSVGNGGAGAVQGESTVEGGSTATIVGGATSASVTVGGSSSASTSGSMGGGGATNGSAGNGATTVVTGAGGSIGGTGGEAAVGGVGGSGGAASRFLVFLLIGQSNMEGAPQPEAQDREEDPRIQVLAYDNCSNLGRSYNEWYTASPPLHSCQGGVGPGDYFAKTLIENLPEGYTIGLVPLGVNGAPIDVFRKNIPRPGWYLPPDDHWETGFEWIVSRAQKAQETGVIRGILFHQGESDAGDPEWVDKVAGLVADLRTDLGLGSAPFLAGEVYRDGMAAEHNLLVNQLPDVIDNAYVVSSQGLTGTDVYHFDLVSQRELGRRYAGQMWPLLGQE